MRKLNAVYPTMSCFGDGKGDVRDNHFLSKCANTFVEDCMFPRPGLNQIYFGKKNRG